MGIYELPTNSFAQPVNDTTIVSDDASTTLEDIATGLTQCITKTGESVCSAAIDFASGIELAGVAVSSTAAELNILDGVTADKDELNLLDGCTSTTAELNILDGCTSTATELNVVDGDTADSSTTIVDADQIVVNNDGTMEQTAVTDLLDYATGGLKTKVLSIGAWDMDATSAVNVNHGLTITDIRSCVVMIINDAGAEYYQLDVDNGTTTGGYYSVQATFVRCLRHSAGAFDNTFYNDGVMNRGYIIVQYAY